MKGTTRSALQPRLNCSKPAAPVHVRSQRLLFSCRSAEVLVNPSTQVHDDTSATASPSTTSHAAHAPAIEHGASASGCPVMRQLQPLPTSDMGWWERTKLTATNPALLQKRSLNGRPFVLSSFLMQPALLVADHDSARELVASEGRAITVGWPESVVQLTGKSSIINAADLEHHRALRRLINPVLRQDAVDAAVPQIQQLVVSYFDRWADEAAAGRTVKAYPEMKKLAFEVIAQLLVEGLDAATLATMRRYFQQWLSAFFTPPPFVVDAWPFPFHSAMNARRGLYKILQDQVTLVRQRVAAAAAEQPGRAPGSGNATTTTTTSARAAAGASGRAGAAATILERMVLERDEDGRGLSDEEIVDSLILMFFAGHDTSASALTSMLHILAQHPHVVQRLREEQRAVVAAHGEQISGEALRCMPYAEATMRELFRYRVIIPAVIRTTKEETELQGHAVPKGLMVSIGLATMIKEDPRFSSVTGDLAPECFAPERFLSEEGRRQGTQVPFGIGNRICPGIALAQTEIMVVLAVLARGYDFKADWNTGYSMFPIPRPNNDLPVFFTKVDTPAA